MGASQSEIYSDDLFKNFQKDKWKRNLDLGLYQLWENIQTKELCEAYKLDYIPQQEELQHYRFRHYNQNADNFVQIRYVDVEKKQTLCYHGESYVLTQFIPVKLSDIQNLTFPEACSILKSTFRAFHTMEAFHGPFIPNEQLIGINLNGRPKIWLNKNHSKNRAQKEIKAEIWQKHMGEVSENVKRIIQFFEQKLKEQQFPTQFRDYFSDNVINFSQASEYVEEYCQKYHIKIPQRIEYLRYIEDQDVLTIVNEHLSGGQAHYHSFEEQGRVNYDNTQEVNRQKVLVREESKVRILSRNGSQQNFNNPHVFQSHYVSGQNIQLNPQPAQVMVNNAAPVQRVILSPMTTTVQRSNSFNNIIIPPTNTVHLNQPRQLSSNQVVFVKQLPKTSSNKIIQIVPPHISTNVLTSKTIVNQVRQINTEDNVNQNIFSQITPRHVNGNHVTFVPPNKITQYQLPIRTQVSQVKQVLLKTPQYHQQGTLPAVQSKQQQQQSIHEKMRQLVNDNENCQQQYQKQRFINHESHLITQNEDQQHMHQQQQVHEQFQHGYINDDSQYVPQHDMYYDQNQNFQEENRSSQPDWEAIRRQQQLKQQHDFQIKHQNVDNEHFQSQNYDHLYERQLTHQKHQQGEISPIKSSTHKDVTQFEGHYAMFSKYAGMNHQLQQNQLQQNHNNDFSEHYQRGNTVTNSLQQKNQNQLNQSENISQEQHQRQQSIPHSLLQSQEQFRHLSSKNTSINRGTKQESSGTMVIHDSKENIYQGVLQEKFDKIVIQNADQQQQNRYDGEQASKHQEYDEQYVEDERNRYAQSVEDTGEQNEHRNEVVSQQQQSQEQPQNQGRIYQEYYQQNQNKMPELIDQNEQQAIEQGNRILKQAVRQMEEQRLRELEQQQKEYVFMQQQKELERQRQQYQEQEQYQEEHQEQQPDYRSQQEQPNQKPLPQSTNEYNNLHFRNQSQQLYQYTPVDSVYKKQPINSGSVHNYYPLPRPHYPSGVEEITQIESHQDIENYIRNKYSNLIGANVAQPAQQMQQQYVKQHQQQYEQNQQHEQKPIIRKRSNKDTNTRAMTFAKPVQEDDYDQQQQVNINQYDQNDYNQYHEQQPQEISQIQQRQDYRVLRVESYHQKIYPNNLDKKQTESEQQQLYLNVDNGDFLDVGNLEKSLDRKYNKPNVQEKLPKQVKLQSPKHTQNIRSSQMSQEDGMNIAALDQRLQKFEQRQSIEREKSQRKLQVYTEQLSSRQNNELNFNELDNIVQLMDKKIQESQKKSKQNHNNDHNVSDYSIKQGSTSRRNQLDHIALQTSINANNNDSSLKNIPILGRQQISIASNSKPPSKRDYVKNYGFDSQDFASKKDYSISQYQPMLRNQSYNSNKRPSQNSNYAYENQYKVLSPVAQMERKFENYSSSNFQNFSNQTLPKFTLDSGYQQTSLSRKSSRRSTRNNEDAKKIADKIADKYDKYMNDSSASGNPFAKKSYYDSGASYESSSKNSTSGYADYSSKYNARDTGSYPSNRQVLRKKSSYLNPIEQLNGQHNSSPYRQDITPKSVRALQSANPLQQSSRENILKHSNSGSRIGSKTNLGGQKPGRNSKVSYDELRDLLWK